MGFSQIMSFSIIVLACENGWVEGSDASCYKFEMTALASWYDAQKACGAQEAELAALETIHEIYWMRGYRSIHAALRSAVWTAGFQDKNGAWQWAYNGEASPIIAFNWANGQPDGEGANGKYAKGSACLSLFGQVKHPDANYHFDDDNCVVKRGYICEKYDIDA